MTEQSGRILCYNHGRDCMNNAVGEADMADGKGIQWYCRNCMTNNDMIDVADMIIDESLIFCETEWEAQGKND